MTRVGNFVDDQIQKPINPSPAVRLAQREMQNSIQWLAVPIQPDHCVGARLVGLANRRYRIAPEVTGCLESSALP